jgi:nucleoside permease NupC
MIGILLQFILGVFILRTDFGFKLFKFLSEKITNFLDYTEEGCKLVFGNLYKDHYFAFKVIKDS